MSDDLHRLADGTLAFLPERLNRDPVVLRGLTNDEMWVALGTGAAAGFVVGLPLAIALSIAMLPTTVIICMAIALFGAGSVLRTLKRARPDTWLYRQAEWLAASRLGFGAEVLTHNGAWTVRCTRRRLLQAQPVAFADDSYHLGTQGEVIDDRVMYTIGGGSAVGSSASRYRPNGIGVGTSWKANMMCGQMDLQSTLQNQLNGATEGFQQIMGNVIQSATQAVMSLPALIIQRANPGLYELLSNGVLQGRIDFDRSMLTCRGMAEKMADKVDQAGWGALAKNQEMHENLEQSGGDAVTAVKDTETNNGNRGITWIGGEKAGGSGQRPILATADVVKTGYNLLHNRGADDESALSADDCQGGGICQTWTSPEEAAEWAAQVIGETEVSTCDDCETLRTTAGRGLTPAIQEAYQEHLKGLQNLLSGSTDASAENLRKVSSSMLPVSRGVIEALREDPEQDLLARRLASETALSSVIDKALLLQRTLLAGGREPNVASARPAQATLAGNLDTLEREIRLLQTDLQVRQMLATNTASLVLDRHAGGAEASRSIGQKDPEPNRLKQADGESEE